MPTEEKQAAMTTFEWMAAASSVIDQTDPKATEALIQHFSGNAATFRKMWAAALYGANRMDEVPPEHWLAHMKVRLLEDKIDQADFDSLLITLGNVARLSAEKPSEV